MNQTLAEKIKLLPDSPGIYRMYNAAGEVIYVGKAINLKNRVRQYFQNSEKPPKVQAMVRHIVDFEYVLTANETEALTLESNLIKALQPRYNILLKDDKHFPYVRLDVAQDFPRFEVVRRVKKDGARYFGPYLSGLALRAALNLIRDAFPVRHCKKDLKKAIARGERPCLMYHLGKCCAPCSGQVSREEYHALLDSVCRFLEGYTGPILERLTEDMQRAAENMEYERAADLRDRIAQVKSLGEKQKAISTGGAERDVFALVREEHDAIVYGLFVRGGKIIGAERFAITCADEEADEVMASFLKQFYNESGAIPAEIVVRDPLHAAEQAEIETWLSDIRGKKTSLFCPQRGEKRKQADMAYANGLDAIRKARELEHRAWERGEGAMLRLCAIIGLEEIPRRMECYDNSHIRGRDTVSGMVVFVEGKPAPKEYRRFRIKAEAGGDDLIAMREVLTRRLERAKAGDVKFMELPDLLVVDGGREQLNVALEVLAGFGLELPAIGLAERSESIILPDNPDPIVLGLHDPALHVLQRIRDEAHRFAITYHRSLRAKNALMSELDGIQGIGPKRKKALFDHFLTLDAIRAADVETLCAAKDMSRAAAEAVYAHFHMEKPVGS
ncbi:MAG: excinuclease ABC subunit UvrC [Christensenellaceae bacterium]|jgi:excinuclease ABC subunit C|nr:excinuclease ABC subunit UvrC [Christensenellaceae bacterium]